MKSERAPEVAGETTQAALAGLADGAQRSEAPFIDSAQRSAAPFIDSAQRSAAPFIDEDERTPPYPSGLALLLNRLSELLGAERVDGGRPPHVRCLPRTPAEVAEVLKLCKVGGVKASLSQAPQALVHLDLSGLRQLLRVDEQSQLCEAQAGLPLHELEHELRGRGLSLGPLPPGSWRRTLGAALSAPRPAEASPGLGRLRDRPLRVSAVLPGRHEVALPQSLAPRRAAGPDLKQLILGGRGRLGVITAATLGLARAATRVGFLGLRFARAADAVAALRAIGLTEAGNGPTDAQVLNRALLGALGRLGSAPVSEADGAALLLRQDGLPEMVEAALRRHGELGRAHGSAGTLEEATCRLWLMPELDDAATVAALWPAHQRVVATGDLDLGAALDSADERPRLLCGVHLRGAALCSDAAHALPESTPEELLYQQVLRQVDPVEVLV